MNHLSPDLLNAYLDEQLTAPARAEVETHLAECAPCWQQLATLRAVFVALDALQAEPIPVDLTPHVLARIQPSPLSTWVKLLFAAQLALIVLLAVWLAPTLADWLRATLPTSPFPTTFDVSADGLVWLNARLADVAQLWSDVARPSSPLDIAPTQWVAFGILATVVWLVASTVPILILLNVKAGPAQFAGFALIFILLTFASIGAAGLAALMGERLRGGGLAASSYGALLRGAIVLELAGVFPIIGWFIVIPLITVTTLGAAAFALLHWIPRSVMVSPMNEAAHVAHPS